MSRSKNNCLGNIRFEVIDSKVITYIDGEKIPDMIPMRAKLILYHYLKNNNVPIAHLAINGNTIQKILELDSFVTKELIFDFEGDILEDDELSDFFEYIPQILNELESIRLLRSKMNENIIQRILYTADLVVLHSLQ